MVSDEPVTQSDGRLLLIALMEALDNANRAQNAVYEAERRRTATGLLLAIAKKDAELFLRSAEEPDAEET